jgi:pimeloyl-ACP methyl ester carboxylesterase
MFRDLIPRLADRYHVIAPDYPGFGRSSMPTREQFKYTFDNLADVIDRFLAQKKVAKFAMYVQDYGAPVGYRLFEREPTRVTGLIVQNGNAYDEGLDNDFWKPLKAYWANPTPANREPLRAFTKLEATKWQYVHGAPDQSRVSPDAWTLDQVYLDRPGNDEVQLDLFLSYGSNPPRYAGWQKLFRQHQPPALIVWGKNDTIFPPAGAEPYRRDLKDVELHLLDAGHFALEERGAEMARLIHDFLDRKVAR